MTYIVNDKCIKCKLMDCVEVCPVDCFYEGENMLAINPDEFIDCGVCEPECQIDAIEPDYQSSHITKNKEINWVDHNQKYSEIWPRITKKGTPPEDEAKWRGVPDEFKHFSEKPGEGS